MAAPRKPRKAGQDSANLYEPCVTCKKPRTLCIRVRRAPTNPLILNDFGHANLSVQEEGQAPITYGNWPKKEGNGDNDIRKNDPGDDPAKDSRYRSEDVKCKELTPEEEKKLEQAVNKKQIYSLTDNNCSAWSGSTWNSVTGDSLNYGANTNLIYNSPSTLLESMNPSPPMEPLGSPL